MRRAIMILAGLLAWGCDGETPDPGAVHPPSTSAPQGAVRVDGSSTVFPISEAVAEEFLAVDPSIRVTVGLSGTGGGFQKFIAGEIDINDASRPITAQEASDAAMAGIGFVELPIAYDGLSLVVHPENTWVDHLSVAELRRIWEPGSRITRWNQVRPSWPDQELRLYGAGHDSGTFDYFTLAINGEEGACRADYTASEDDNTLVQGVAGDPNALGFFGYAYYERNTDKVRVVPIDGGAGPVTPSPETISDGTYQPLSRPVFIYVSTASAARPEVRAFVDFYLENAAFLSRDVGYIPLPEDAYELARQRFAAGVTGSVFAGRDTVGVTIEDLLAAEQ
ncbi:MAG: PstS family phosphate ABC transporter substrate-binding protein [Candidatus Sumerlaeia bacterium]|nr:PstS family phosphate ABC transporter substrate-binding protein [Candidatus Sumerlaeia bacterium]